MIIGNPITLGGGGKPKKLLSSLTEGSLVSVLEDGKLVPFYVAKHNYEADLNGEGRTLLVRKDIHSNGVWNSANTHILDGSTIDTWLNGDYFNLLSTTAKASIPSTAIEYTQGVNVSTAVSTTNKNVFLLSLTELGLSSSSVNTEGETLPIASTLRVATVNGNATAQWTRSPLLSSASALRIVLATGAMGSENANASCGIRPCFTLPANMALNEEPYADGSWGLADEYDGNIASPTKKPNTDYVSGIVDLDVDTLNTIANAISNNNKINWKTSVVYYDNGNMHREISVGDTIGLEIDGTSYLFDVVGFNHDNLVNAAEYGEATATGKAGFTLQMHTVYPTTYQMNASATNSGGYDSSDMYTTHLPALLAKMSSDVRGIIKTVTKLSSIGNGNTFLESISCDLFLLAHVEISGVSGTDTPAGEGSQYAYYAAGNSRIKSLGANNHWWCRSPYVGNTKNFCCVNDAGAVGAGVGANYSIGVAFALCI